MHNDLILTIAEVAVRLRCSKAHLYKLILGQVKGAGPLAVISLGRRKLVRASTLQAWISANERALAGVMLASSPEVEAADA